MNLSSRMRSSPKDATASLLADDRASCMAILLASILGIPPFGAADYARGKGLLHSS